MTTIEEYAPYIAHFPKWAADQFFQSGLVCKFEVEKDTPYFDRAGDLWAIWANHDCMNWEVDLTIILEANSANNVIAEAGIPDDVHCS